MNNDLYWLHADQRLRQAVRAIAVSSKPLPQRLDETYWNHLHGLHEPELPTEAQSDLSNVKNELTGGRALALDDAAATNVARAICDLQSKVHSLRAEALEAERRRLEK